jgi:hypothetical protein
MKTPAAIASLTVVGSIAYAAGSQGTAGKQPPVMPSGPQAHSMQEEVPQGRTQMIDGCTRGADKDWFTTVHLLPDCGDRSNHLYIRAEQSCSADINNDGDPEYLRVPYIGTTEGNLILRNGQTITGSFVDVTEVTCMADRCTTTMSSVVRKETMAVVARTLSPDTDEGTGYFGLRDMDSDGDLDLVVFLVLRNAASSESNRWLWLENTGFQHPARLTGDLDADGKVNGADLGILLSNWRN